MEYEEIKSVNYIEIVELDFVLSPLQAEQEEMERRAQEGNHSWYLHGTYYMQMLLWVLLMI